MLGVRTASYGGFVNFNFKRRPKGAEFPFALLKLNWTSPFYFPTRGTLPAIQAAIALLISAPGLPVTQKKGRVFGASLYKVSSRFLITRKLRDDNGARRFTSERLLRLTTVQDRVVGKFN